MTENGMSRRSLLLFTKRGSRDRDGGGSSSSRVKVPSSTWHAIVEKGKISASEIVVSLTAGGCSECRAVLGWVRRVMLLWCTYRRHKQASVGQWRKGALLLIQNMTASGVDCHIHLSLIGFGWLIEFSFTTMIAVRCHPSLI